MKKHILTLTGIFITAALSAQQPRIQNTQLTLRGDKLFITYDITGNEPLEKVWIEVTKPDGTTIKPNTVTGDTGHVSAGKEKQMVWDMVADGYDLGGIKIEVEINSKEPEIKKNIIEDKKNSDSIKKKYYNTYINFSFGYQKSSMNDLNEKIYYSNTFFLYDMLNICYETPDINFKPINNIYDFSFNIRSTIKKHFFFNAGINFLFTKRQTSCVYLPETYKGINIIDTNECIEQYNKYKYGFHLYTFILSATPGYIIYKNRKFALNAGIGPDLYFLSLVQEGIADKEDNDIRWDFEQKKNIYHKFNIMNLHCLLDFCYNLTNKLGFRLYCIYRLGNIKSFGKNSYPYTNIEENGIYPISKTNVNYTGFSYGCGINYNF